MTAPRLYPTFDVTTNPCVPENPIPPFSANLMLLDAIQFRASAQPLKKMEIPFHLEIEGGVEVFTHCLGDNIFGDKKSLGKYKKIMETIDNEWPALPKIIDSYDAKSRIAIFAVPESDHLLNIGKGGGWTPWSPHHEPFLKNFNTAIVVDVNRGKYSVRYMAHELWHEVQSLNNTVKSGRCPHDLPVSLGVYANAAEEYEVVTCWWKGVEKYRNAKLPAKDPRHLIYGHPVQYYVKFLTEAKAGRQVEAKKAWGDLLHEIGSYMASARIEHGYSAIQEHAKELGELIDTKLGVKAFTDPCSKNFKTKLISGAKRCTGRVFAALGLGLDVYHEYTLLPETVPNKKSHALINGVMRNLVGQAIGNTSLGEALLYDTSEMGTPEAAAAKIEALVGKERLQKILTKGHQARYREQECLPMLGGQYLEGEERAIYFSYMNVCARDLQESMQNPITGLYDTLKSSFFEFTDFISYCISTSSPGAISVSDPFYLLGGDIARWFSNLKGWSPEDQKQMVTDLTNKGIDIFTNIGKRAHAGLSLNNVNPKKNEPSTTEETRTIQEQLLRNWMEEFQNTNVATINISIQGISEDDLSGEKPLTEELYKIIQSELDKTQKQIIPKLVEISQIGKEIDIELGAKCDDSSKGEYFQKISEAVANFTAVLYMDAQRRFEEKKAATERERQEIEFDRRKKQAQSFHYQEYTEVTLSSIERDVWNVLHPSGNFRKSLNDMVRYTDLCSKREKEIRTLIDQKNQITKNLGKQDSRLNLLERKITRKFEKMIKTRDKAIKKSRKAQKDLGVLGSFFSVASLIPPLTPIALGAKAVTDAISNGIGIGAIHHEKRRMRTEFKFRNTRERIQGVREGLAGHAQKEKSDIFALEQEKIHMRQERAYILESNLAVDPAELRKQLQIDNEAIAADIEERQKALQTINDSIQTENEKAAKIKESLDPVAVENRLKELGIILNKNAIKMFNQDPIGFVSTVSSFLINSKKGKGTSTDSSESTGKEGKGTSTGKKSGGSTGKKGKSTSSGKKSGGSTEKGKDPSTDSSASPDKNNSSSQNIDEDSRKDLEKKILYYMILATTDDKTSYELVLAEQEQKLSVLESQSNNIQKELDILFEEQAANREAIEREERLAALKDDTYKVIMREFNKYEPKNLSEEKKKQYNEIQMHLDNAFQLYHSLRGDERAAVGGMLGALQDLFLEISEGQYLLGLVETFSPSASKQIKKTIARTPLYCQFATKLVGQCYRLYDAFDNLKFAQGQLNIIRVKNGENTPDVLANIENFLVSGFDWIESDKLNSPLKLLMNNRSIQDFGVLRYVNEILVPALGVVTSSLACVRIMSHIANGCPRVLSPEEMKLDRIQEFLTKFSEHLDQKFIEVVNYLENGNQKIIESISLMRSELGTLANEMSVEIDYVRHQILSKQEEINYNDHTVRIKNIGNEISKARTKLEISSQTAEKKREEILKFFKKINIALKHDSDIDINAGVVLGDGGTVNSLVDIQNAVKNPDIYTGLIAHKAHFSKKLGSLYLFNLIYENYLYGVKLTEPYLKNSLDPLTTRIADCLNLLEIQGRNLKEFFGKADVIVSNCRIEQDEILKSLEKKLSSTRNQKELHIKLFTDQQRESYSKTITSNSHYVGAQKFRFAEIFITTPMAKTAKPQTYGVAKQFGGEFATTTTINGVQTAVGVGVLGPAYLCIGAMGELWSLLKATNATTEYYLSSQKLKKNHDDSTLLNLLDRQVAVEPKKGVVSSIIGLVGSALHSNGEKLTVRVWLAQDGTLCSKISRLGGFVFSKTDLSTPSERYEVAKGNTSFDVAYSLLGRNIQLISNDSHIKVEEIQKLCVDYHLPNKTKYDAALKKLLIDYQAWLIPDSKIEEKNAFYLIKDSSQFLSSVDSLTVPLAFPKELLRELETRMDPDQILIEATGIGFLVPSYCFKKDKDKDGHVLSIQYHFIDTLDPLKRELYEQFDVAYVDDITVKSFAKPSFSGVENVNNPNLNELLIQLTYTNKDLGAPGNNTIFLGGNRWVAPSMRPFPGFYKLWRHYPECAIHFNSRYYTQEMSYCLTMCASGSLKTAKASAANEIKEHVEAVLKRSRSTKTGAILSIWKAIREAKQDLSESKRRLEENYNLLIAYCRLISKLDGHSLRQKLENDFGILDPSHFDSFYDFIIGGIDLPDIDESKLTNFKTLLNLIPSAYLGLLNKNHRPVQVKIAQEQPKPARPKTANSAASTNKTTQRQPSSARGASSSQSSQSSRSYSQEDEDLGIDEGNPVEMKDDETYEYSGTDIEIVQTFLFKDEMSINLLSPMTLEQLVQSSNEIQNKVNSGKPLLFVYKLPEQNHYVAVAMIKTGDKQVKILYKDSMGGACDQCLNIFPQDYTVSISSSQTIEQVGDHACGLYSLDNLGTMIHYLKNNDTKDTFIASFARFKDFCSNVSVKDLRKTKYPLAYRKGMKLIERRAENMKALRPLITEHHQAEIDAIADKIRLHFPGRTVMNVKADDVIKKADHTNTIFVEFALKSNTIENQTYDYGYRIYSSNEISIDDLKTTVSAIGLSEGAYEIERTLYKEIGNLKQYTYVLKIASDRAAEIGIIAKQKYSFENNNAQEGVNLIGECPTSGNKVYISRGYEEVDFAKAAYHSKCPCCQKNAVNVREIFFKNCSWETTTYDSEGNTTETKGVGSHTINLNEVEFVEFKLKKIT